MACLTVPVFADMRQKEAIALRNENKPVSLFRYRPIFLKPCRRSLISVNITAFIPLLATPAMSVDLLDIEVRLRMEAHWSTFSKPMDICFRTRIKGALRQKFFVALLPDGRIVESKAGEATVAKCEFLTR